MTTTALTPSQAKTLRLLNEGRVKPMGLAHDFEVIGDHGIHRTFVSADLEPIYCTCPATGTCTHLDAAVLRAAATPDVAVLLDHAVADRTERGAAA